MAAKFSRESNEYQMAGGKRPYERRWTRPGANAGVIAVAA